MSEWSKVRSCRSEREARQLALVLTAVGIPSRIHRAGTAVQIEVARHDLERAWRELAEYEDENRKVHRPPPIPDEMSSGRGAVMAFLTVMFVIFGAQRRETFGIDWTGIGAVQADLILGGQWWRTITALGLHGGLEHLLGNLVFGTVFAILLSRTVGAGVAWLAIVLAGALGNGLNVAFQPETHTSIGASTALFGAIGALAGHTQITRGFHGRSGLRAWTALAGGAMLVVFLGVSGERTDIGAHVAGFVVGVGLGLGIGGLIPRPDLERKRVQWMAGSAAAGLFTLAWLLALGLSTPIN